MRFITFLTGFSAVALAMCAAYFSVTGFGLLFSGAAIAVYFMAGLLEFGKLVATSHLHNYWKETNVVVRNAMVSIILILVLITSAGIFGFLSNAYTQTQISVNQVESRVTLFETQRNNALVDIPRWENRINTLSENRTRQEVRYDSLVAGEHWVNARKTTDLITEANVEINSLSDQITQARVDADSLSTLVFDTRLVNIDTEREIGGFKFVAEALGVELDTVVKWFIFLLIFVFDPLALLLIISFNNAIRVDRENKKDPEDSIEEDDNMIFGDMYKHGEAFWNKENDSEDDEILKRAVRDDNSFNEAVATESIIEDKKPTHYDVATAGGRVIIKAKEFKPHVHIDARPLFDHIDPETI